MTESRQPIGTPIHEGASLQRGMNFGIGGTHSVILMSLQPNAPYNDRIEADGTVLIYEGHDEPRTDDVKDPKAADQPLTSRIRVQGWKAFT